MNKVCITIHGFNVSDGGASTVERCTPYLREAGYEVVNFDYGWEFLLGVWLHSKNNIIKIQALVERYHKLNYHVVLLGHSNGGCLAWLSTQTDDANKCADTICCINPALNTTEVLGKDCKKAIVLYSPEDDIVRIAQVCFLLRPLKWGDMGYTGHKGYDPRVVNMDIDELTDTGENHIGHSDFFKPEILRQVMPRLRAWLS